MQQSVTLPKYQLTIKHFQQMVAQGILSPAERIELLEGELINMPPIGSQHASKVDKLVFLFTQKLDGKAILRVQNPIILDECTQPQPDIALLHYRDDFYAESHPHAEEIYLLVEVADTSLAYDRQVKIPLYAQHRIPEVWVIDVAKKRVEIYLEPNEWGYRCILCPGNTEQIAVSQLSHITFNLAELWH